MYDDLGEAVTFCSECGERVFGEPPDQPDEGKEFWQRESGWTLVRLSDGRLEAVNTEPGETPGLSWRFSYMLFSNEDVSRATTQRMIDDGVPVISEEEWKAMLRDDDLLQRWLAETRRSQP